MEKIFLNGEWLLHDLENNYQLSAIVPGCVHSDLIRCGIIKDIFYRDNARKIQWIENKTWVYERSFEITETKDAILVFEGLDTYCDIEINGKKVGKCENMFIEHRFEIEEYLVYGQNHIRVIFYPPALTVKDREKRQGAFTTERLYTRRVQCTYGWDWVERFVTCGIYRPIYITYNNIMYCENVYIYTTHVDQFGAQVCVLADFLNYHQGALVSFEVISPEHKVIYKKNVYINTPQFRLMIDIENPELWDILNKDNPIYTLRINVGGEVFEENFGIRTVRILQRKDEIGSKEYSLCQKLQQTPSGEKYDRNTEFSSFEVILNGRSVMCKGANWVPCEPFPSEETDEKITKILTMAKEAGMNIIRVWGGGLFEREHFYNECDRLGLMVVQDFLMACGQYPEEEEWFIEHLNKEAEFAAKKLRNHPSLIWWNGDNENAINGSDEDGDYIGRNASLFGSMPAILKNDFTRSFFISSPWGGKTNASKTVGTTHHTQFLRFLFSYIDSDRYGDDYLQYLKEYTARFIAEEPCFGAASLYSLKEFMTNNDIFNSNGMWLYHTKGNPALNDELFHYFYRFAEKVFGRFQNGQDRLFKLQYLQYEWIRVSLENARRNRGFCNGIIYWMLNDCWPSAAGWSMIDYYTRPKSGYYAFKKYARDFIVSMDEQEGQLFLYLCNDGLEELSVKIRIEELNIQTESIEQVFEMNMIAPAGKTICEKIQGIDLNNHKLVLANYFDSIAYYKRGGCKMELTDPPDILRMDENSITLHAKHYIHSVELFGDCIFSDNFFMMKPGEIKTIKFEGRNESIGINAYKLS